MGHPQFETVCGVAVMLNVLAIGIETHIACEYLGETEEPWESICRVQERLFCIFFLSEWVLRIQFHGKAFFQGDDMVENVFDTVVVLSQVFQLTVAEFFSQGTLMSSTHVLATYIRLYKVKL